MVHVVVVRAVQGRFRTGVSNRAVSLAVLIHQCKAVGDGGFLHAQLALARIAAVAEDAGGDGAAHVIAIVAAAVNIDCHIGNQLVRADVSENTDRHVLAVQGHVRAVDALRNIDGQGIVLFRQLYLAENTGYVVGTHSHFVDTAVVAATVQIRCRTGNGVAKIACHTANSARALATATVGSQGPEIIAV